VGRSATVLLLIIAATLVALARGLPADAFYAGDSGVKLIATRHAVDQPLRPLQIPLPEIAGQPAPFVEHFFIVHDQHSHAVTPELFPVLSAPFVALFGLRGAYVLPALGLLLTLAATAWLASLLDSRRSQMAVILAVFLGTPLLFYGLELWEHTLAAGVAALATGVFLKAVGRTRAAPSGLPGESRVHAVGAGLLFGVAVLLRPEALWFAVAVLACSPLLRSRPSATCIAAVAAGMAAALLPLLSYTLVHFGHPVPPHIAGNPGLVSGDWASMRQSVTLAWFVSRGPSNFWRIAPAILLAFVWRPTSHAGAGARRGRPFLLAVAVLTVALVVLVAPNDGGAQWGPRYLLLAYLPLAILATDTLTYVVRLVGALRRGRMGARLGRTGAQLVFTAAVAAAVASLFIGSAWLQRAAYKELRGAKQTYARLVEFVQSETAAGRAVVTDLWWVDQIAASLAQSRRFFFASDADAAADVLRRLSEAGEREVTLIRSPVDSPGHFTLWLKDSCYTGGRERGNGEGLIAIQLTRSCSTDPRASD
jgi:hypothetical protein